MQSYMNRRWWKEGTTEAGKVKKKQSSFTEMKTTNKKTIKFAGLVLVGASILSGGCSAPKDISYFQDLDKTMVIETQARQSIRIRPEDKLSIVVSSKDPALASLFNLPVMTNRLGQNNNYTGASAAPRNYGGSSEGMSAYTVSPDGNIDFPILGTLHVAGMTRYELSGFIKGELMGRDLVKDPTVTVEFLNTGISVLGEVKSPGRYDMNRDQITILDAISLAGDLDLQGNRKNIKVLRNVDGKAQVYTVDLTSGKDVFKSPVYYLQQDDIVYVEPNDYRKRQTTVNGNTSLSASFWISVVSVCSSLAVLIVNLAK